MKFLWGSATPFSFARHEANRPSSQSCRAHDGNHGRAGQIRAERQLTSVKDGNGLPEAS